MFSSYFFPGGWFSYNWDILAVVLVVTIFMVLQTVYLCRQKIEKRLVSFAWFVYIAFCVISVACIDYMGREERRNGADRLLEIATTCALAVEIDGHAGLSFDTPRDDPTWEHLMRLIFEWGDRNERVASIYTVRMQTRTDESGRQMEEPVFFLCPEADFDRDGVITRPLEDEIPAGTPYTVPSERFLEEIFAGRPYFAEELVVDDWGSWYTAGAPLLDKEKNVVGILCVDFWPEVWREDVFRARVWPLALFGMFLALFFVVVNFVARLIVAVRLLTVANQKAEEAAQSKTRFLANMSHEIRTPINAILGFIQILADRRVGRNQEDLDMFELIRKNGKDLLTIIDDILTFSKVDSGSMAIETVPVSPRQLLEDVKSNMAPRFESKPDVKFIVETVGEIPEIIMSDPTRLRQIITNLVGNAVKFTTEGHISVRCECLDAEPVSAGKDHDTVRLRFSVTDTGIGISPEKFERLFQPFMQADSSSTRKYGGTGLGLSISRRLAELLGGTLTVESEPGHGSRFDLILNAVLPSPDQFDSSVLSAILSSADSDGAKKKTTKIPETAEIHLDHRRFLVVDDGKINQLVLSTSLKDHGAEVETAENGLVALEKIDAADASGRPFDVVFMDVQMPVMDGLEATKQLRARGYRRPIVAVTANAFAEDRQSALSAGCNEYMAKPVNIAEMLQLVLRLTDSETTEHC